MERIKTFGLAAIAAAALMAFVGAGTASATVLCKESITTACAAAGNGYAKGTTIEATLTSGNSMEFIGPSGIEDTCTTSKINASTGNAGSSTETVNVGASSLTWSNCTYPTTTTRLGTLEIHWISGADNATLTASGFEWTTETLFGSCSYKTGTGNDLGTIAGGNPASIALRTSVVGGGACGCSSTETWFANYTFTIPKPLYIAES